jgi:hypothetical protein
MQALLSKLKAERWDWAAKGIDDFRSGFLGLKEANSKKKRVIIGVYGPTQVGKTTLILKILGIKEKDIGGLSKALRGKRSYGNSATVTSTIYQQSNDETFKVEFPNGEKKLCKYLKQLEGVMSEVRKSVEQTMDFTTKPIIIQIAQHYFDHKELAGREQTLEILDLPGDNSREKKEVEHVERCLKEFLPQCTVCLLMEISSQLVSLTQLKQDHVRDWRWQPSHFRIILTRAVSDASIKEKLLKDEFKSSKEFQFLFSSELNRILDDSEESDIKVYPLEFGDSWEGLEKTQKIVFQKAKPFIDEIYQELIKDLCSVYSPRNELLQQLDLDGVIKKRQNDERKSLKRQLDEVEAIFRMTKANLIKTEKRLDQLENHKKRFLEDQKRVLELDFSRPKEDELLEWAERIGSDRTASSLRTEFRMAMNHLEKDYRKATDKWNRDVLAVTRFYDIPFKKVMHSFKKATIDVDKLFNRYLLKSKFNRDLGHVRNQLETANKENYELIKKEMKKQMKSLDKMFKTQELTMTLDIKVIKDELASLEEKSLNLQSRIAQIKDDQEQSKKKWAHDENRFQQRDLFIKKSYLDRSHYFKEKLLSVDTSPTEKWVYHQYWNLMSEDMEWIIKYDHEKANSKS